MSSLPLTRVHLQPRPADDAFDVYMEVPDGYTGPYSPMVSSAPGTRHRTFAILSNPVFTRIEEGYVAPVAMGLPYDSAQILLEALWEAGIRPAGWGKSEPAPISTSSGADPITVISHLTQEVIAAKSEHIADLRHVAGITKPKDRPSQDPTF